MKKIFSAIAFTSFFLVLGSVGAMERYTISLVQGAVQMFGFMASFGLSAYLAGSFTERSDER